MYIYKLIVWALKMLMLFMIIVSCAPEAKVKIQENSQHNYKSTESKSINIEYKDTIIEYKLRDEKPHTLNIDCSNIDKNKIDSLIIAIYAFNKEYYVRNKYSVALVQLFQSKTEKLITISGFENKFDVMDYYHTLINELKFKINSENFVKFIYAIHNYNSILLMESKFLEGYMDFFIEKYVKDSSDTFRNNFNASQLYTSNDTSNLYVCIKSVNRKELDKESVKSSVTEYNNMNFPDLNLNIHSILIKSSNDLTIFTISKFTNKSEAFEYRNHLVNKYSDIENDIFIISQNNYITMLTEESIEDYLKFYESAL